MKKHLHVLALLLTASTVNAVATEQQYPVDKTTGLIMAPGWEIVKNQCNACHTSLIIPQNLGNREVWRETIQWMIDTQGLWDLNETWDPVLDYLETYYNESGIDMEIFRRKFLEASQIPPLPEKKEHK